MITRKVRALNLSARDELVEQGPRRREARKICELHVNEITGVVVARIRVGDNVEKRTFDIGDRVRVVA